MAEGFDLVEQDRDTYFRQGCRCLDGANCRIYDRRPERCRSFRCSLLDCLDRGDVRFDGALAIVDEARRLAKVADRLNVHVDGRGAARERWHQVFKALGSGSPEGGRAFDPAWLLAMTALNRYLDIHFRKVWQRQIREDGDVPPEAEERA